MMARMLRGIPRRGPATAALPLLAALLCSCGGPGGPSAPAGRSRSSALASPDVVLITIDTLRYDATGFSGSGKVATPTFDRLAAEGRVFPFAHAHAVMTLPSHACILTGVYPYQHGIRDNAGFVLHPDVETLATSLKRAGYDTGAFVSAFTLDGRFGLKRGFDTYDDRCEGYSSNPSKLAERPGEKTIELAMSWWGAHRAAPRFLWVHLFAPHFPYEPPEPFASRYRAAPYYGEAALADQQLRPLVDALESERDRSPVVVFTSDHGEGLGDHGEQSHGVFAYEETLHVPLVLWSPGRIAPGSDPRPARHVDIVPTLLEILHLAIPTSLPGRSLLTPAEGDAPTYFEALSAWLNRGWAPLYGRIEGTRKAIDLPLPELYDLAADPREKQNLVGGSGATYREMVSNIPPAARREPARDNPERDVVEKLRALGYVASSGAVPSKFDESHDPKNLIGLDDQVNAAVLRYRNGHDADGAIRDLETILAHAPGMSNVYMQLSLILAEQGRVDEALAVLRKAVSRGIGGEKMKIQLARGLSQAGKPDEAWATLSGALDSSNPETQETLGTIAATQGRLDEARARFERALTLDPTYPAAMVDLSVLMLNTGHRDEAKQVLQRALDANPYIPDGWNTMGVILAQEGNLRGAVEAWDRAVRLNPKLAIALMNLAAAAARLGDRPRAEAALQQVIPLLRGTSRTKAEEMLRDLRGEAPAKR